MTERSSWTRETDRFLGFELSDIIVEEPLRSQRVYGFRVYVSLMAMSQVYG